MDGKNHGDESITGNDDQVYMRMIFQEMKCLREEITNLAAEVRNIRSENVQIKNLAANCYTNQKNLLNEFSRGMAEVKKALVIDHANFNQLLTNMNTLEPIFSGHEPSEEPMQTTNETILSTITPGMREIKKENDCTEPELYTNEGYSGHRETSYEDGAFDEDNYSRIQSPDNTNLGCFSSLRPLRIEKLLDVPIYNVRRIDTPSETINLVQVMLKTVKRYSAKKSAIFFRRVLRAVIFQTCGCKENVFKSLACGSRQANRGRTATTVKSEDLIFIPDLTMNRIIDLCVYMCTDPVEVLTKKGNMNMARVEITRLFKNVVKDARRGRFTKMLENENFDEELSGNEETNLSESPLQKSILIGVHEGIQVLYT